MSWVTFSGTTQMSPLNFANDVYSAVNFETFVRWQGQGGTQERTSDIDLLVTISGPVSGPCDNDTTMESCQQGHVADVCLMYVFMLLDHACITLLRGHCPWKGVTISLPWLTYKCILKIMFYFSLYVLCAISYLNAWHVHILMFTFNTLKKSLLCAYTFIPCHVYIQAQLMFTCTCMYIIID